MSGIYKPTVLLAPNAFKGTLTAPEICNYLITRLAGDYKVIALPAGDGGDGTAEIIASYLPGSYPVCFAGADALGRPSRNFYYRNGQIAIIELAGICGLKTLQIQEYDILNANTCGVGKAINHAVENGANNILLCVGGSASVDGGLGALVEMGLKLVTSNSEYKNHLIDLKGVDTCYLHEKFKDIKFTILCDVDNKLYGDTGAAYIFAPQKGASPEQVRQLDQHLKKYARLLSGFTDIDITNLKHGGAAGGITAAFSALLDAQLVSGSEYYLQISGFEKYLLQSQVVITGEGRIDHQSLYGKIPGVIAGKSRERHIPVIAVCGIADSGIDTFEHIFPLVDYAPSAQASLDRTSHYFPVLCQAVKQYLDERFC